MLQIAGFFLAAIIPFSLTPGATCLAAEIPEYLTPLAGEPCDIECLGEKVAVPARNRENEMALTMGATIFTPTLAGNSVVPLAAFYWKHRWDDTRVRSTFSLFVNDFDVSQTFGSFQLLGHFDNNTIPFSMTEIDAGREVQDTAIRWGTVRGRVGAGLRLPVAPYQMDNNLRLQLFYQGGYLYSRRVEETGSEVKLPPNTPLHGGLLRLRYDGLRRNLMELPHKGVATGFDAEFMHRSNWSDADYGGPIYLKSQTQNYLKLLGYLTLATGFPSLSEKNRLILAVNGGGAPYGTLDRFSAFRIGGGPIPSETDDLNRQVFPGAMFDQFPVSKYLITSLEYRREFLPFLYLHLRGTHAWVDREVFTDQPYQFKSGEGNAFSVGITTGFLWESQLDLEYSYDSRIIRNGSTGSNIFVLWSKSFEGR